MPEVDINNYELEIAIEDETKKILDFELLKKYPQYTITTAVMCGGNRRSEMHAVSITIFIYNVSCLNSFY